MTAPGADIYSGRMWRVLVAVVCVVTWASTAPAALTVAEADWDAGAVEAGAKITHRWVLRNDGPRPVALTVKAECGCTTTDADSVVAPDASGGVTASLDSTEMRGRITKRVHVTTDDPAQPPLVLSITADVRRALDVLPSDRPVVRGPVGAFPPIVLTVTTPDDAPFAITDVEHDDLVTPRVETLSPSRHRLTLTPKADLAIGSYSPRVTVVTTRAKADRFALHPTLVVEGPLVVVPPAIRFGSPAQAARVRVSAARQDVRFHVLSVESTDPTLATEVASIGDGRAWDVHVRVGQRADDKPINALLTIKTDVPSQPTLLVRVMSR